VKRALVVAPHPFFSPRGTPFSVYYRTLVTAEQGVRVDLLTYGQGQDVDLPNLRIIRIPRLGFLGPVKTGPSWPKVVLDMFLAVWTVRLLLRHRYDFVHAHEESVFYLRFLKPLFGFKLVYDMHSSLPEQLRNYEFTTSRMLIGLFEKLEDTCLARADAVITICPELARYATARMPDAGRHLLIENSLFEPIRLKDGHRVPVPMEIEPISLPADRLIVLYAGTFESYQGIDLLLCAFAKVREACPEAFLVLVGGTAPQVAEVQTLAEQLGLQDHVLVFERQPQAVVKGWVTRARVLVSPRTRGSNTPLKIYEQLASGVPLVATRILSHTQVLSDDVCFLVEPEPDWLAEGLVRALTDEEARWRISENARRLYDTAYARPVYEGKIRALLEALG
jgi:glycosyltransferase involved in cell wall biosynthesis